MPSCETVLLEKLKLDKRGADSYVEECDDGLGGSGGCSMECTVVNSRIYSLSLSLNNSRRKFDFLNGRAPFILEGRLSEEHRG